MKQGKKLLIASAVAGILAWSSLFLPWWYISGLGPPIALSPVLLLALERKSVELLQLSDGFFGLVVASVIFVLFGGGVGILRGHIHKKLVPLIAGLLVLSAVNILTYAFTYIKIAGAVLCLSPYFFGAPLGWGISYGFFLAGISGVLILLSTVYEI